MPETSQSLLDTDFQHLLHPYTDMMSPQPVELVESAHGCRIQLADGRTLIDGMSSWWAAIHGYNHPRLNQALREQSESMAHIMFGGLTHEPAIRLCRQLLACLPTGLQKVFLCDSGSVSVEVSIKMALQYWYSQGNKTKHKIIALRRAYHGDTFGAMSLCDPVTGMHHLFADTVSRQLFAPAPKTPFGTPCQSEDIDALHELFREHHHEVAALILEPIVQGAGGMFFYSADYLKQARELCDEYGILLIADEIATGFGRSGKLFACEHAGISPDIMCIGKALTGGYMTMAATLCTEQIAETISAAGLPLMHGPTFMANPLACAVASASLELLFSSDWQSQVNSIEKQLNTELAPCRDMPAVADVRVMGAIGVVELRTIPDAADLQARLTAHGVWIRPFGKLVYIMPPYIISPAELGRLTHAINAVCREIGS
jgi:adenosylmethionine-8-amino-7-oxononanoate aminotransferase